MITKMLAFVAAGALVLSGCTAADLRGTPASSPEECTADWQQERRAASGGLVNTGSFAGAIATLVVSSAVSAERKQAANARLRTCMARFGITDVEGYYNDAAETDGTVPAASVVTPRQSVPNAPFVDTASTFAPTGQCPDGASVLFGGAGYCTGR